MKHFAMRACTAISILVVSIRALRAFAAHSRFQTVRDAQACKKPISVRVRESKQMQSHAKIRTTGCRTVSLQRSWTGSDCPVEAHRTANSAPWLICPTPWLLYHGGRFRPLHLSLRLKHRKLVLGTPDGITFTYRVAGMNKDCSEFQ